MSSIPVHGAGRPEEEHSTESDLGVMPLPRDMTGEVPDDDEGGA